MGFAHTTFRKPVGDRPIETQKSQIENPPAPTAWTIAGSDPGGGAGIQADLKVLNAFGVHGCSAITALTAQNTKGVQAVESVSDSMLSMQLKALNTDLPPGVIKTGMLGNAAACSIVSDFLQAVDVPVVCDPVLTSTSGSRLLDPDAVDLLIHGIFPQVKILTPNLPEAEKILGGHFKSMEEAAEQLLKTGVESVLLKGGHAESTDCRDYWTDGKQSLWLSSPRISTRASHGTGCILSSAIAAAMALEQNLPEAVITAKTFLNQCLKRPVHVGTGIGPMRIECFKDDPADRPKVIAGGGG
jgi:hydroxymethylpyrimidine kinase/phosphomethylpyrimidine kinase/thiamine-phosphate diphosphorylase